MSLLLLIVLVLLVCGGLPQVGIHQYGYGPSGVLSFVLIIVLLMILFGHLRI